MTLTQEAGQLELVLDVDVEARLQCEWPHELDMLPHVPGTMECTMDVVAYAMASRCNPDVPRLVCQVIADAIENMDHTDLSQICMNCLHAGFDGPQVWKCWKAVAI